MFLIKVLCEECTRENYVKVVDNRAFCPHCKKYYKVTLKTKEGLSVVNIQTTNTTITQELQASPLKLKRRKSNGVYTNS